MQNETSLVAILEWVVCHKDLVPSSLTAAAEEMLRGDGEMSSKESQRLIEYCYSQGDIGPIEDGTYCYFGSKRGALTATNLRAIAGELDRRNACDVWSPGL